MHIAFISYEFPPETNFGGIGTYTCQLSAALAAIGHDVEVFSCSRTKQIMNECVQPRLLLHRVVADKRKSFSEAVVAVFGARHTTQPFDIVESPEYGAEGAGILKKFTEIAFTIRLHTPFYLHDKHNKNSKKQSLISTWKQHIKNLLKYNNYNKNWDADYLFTIQANSLSSPSHFLAEIIKKEWQLSCIKILPNYYKAADSLLRLPIHQPDKKVIAFIGRLEKRKGIFTIIKAIPNILKHHPNTIIRFIGASGIAPDGTTPMDEYMLAVLDKYRANLHFAGHIPSLKLSGALEDVSLVMIPSIFENFPYVCLESMAAGKAVIISANSGMQEMFPANENRGCVVINPNKPEQLSKAVIYLLDNPELCVKMGMSNREHVIQQFAGEELLQNVVQFYKDTIAIVSTKATSQLPVINQ